jgi:tRNA-2-methylthio-N6-dimethylallyladenosine synthase
MPIKIYLTFARSGRRKECINVILSKDETYGARLMSNGITALVSITRGCDNMCTFAWYLYPWTGDSREPQSIMKEIQDLWDKGLKRLHFGTKR